MARVKLSALLIVAGVLCAGCSLFYSNFFAALDTPPDPKASDYEGPGGLDKLAADLDSPAVVALLAADQATVDEIQAYLAATYDLTAPATADDQTAAALSADLGLKTTQGDDLVNNVVTTIMNPPSSWDIAPIIKSVVPASVLADSSGGAFSRMVDALVLADATYQALGTSIGAYGAPSGMDLGDVAQKAAVAYLMVTVLNKVESVGPYDQATAETQMFDLATGQPNSIDGLQLASSPFSPMPAPLKSIFDAAGAPYPQ